MKNEEKIIMIRRIILVGFILALIFHQGLMRLLNLNIYPYNTFLFVPELRFYDFIWLAGRGNDPYSLSPLPYPPFAFFIMRFFDLFGAANLFVFFLSFILFWVVYIYKNMPGRVGLEKVYTVFIFSFLTYPFLFWFDRGSTECWLFVLLAIFVYYYQRKRYLLGLFVLALAVALRLYAIVFIILFVLDKKDQQIKHLLLLTIVSTGFLYIVSALLIKGSLISSAIGVWKAVLAAINLLTFCWIQTSNTSLLALIKLLLFGVLAIFPGQIVLKNISNYPFQQPMVIGERANEILIKLHFFYPLIALAILIIIFLVMYKTKMPSWKQVTLLTISLLLLPQISFGYRMILLFIPMFLFINDSTTGKYSRYYAVLFALLLIPKNFYYLYADLSIMSIINPVLMIVFIVMIMVEEWKRARA